MERRLAAIMATDVVGYSRLIRGRRRQCLTYIGNAESGYG